MTDAVYESRFLTSDGTISVVHSLSELSWAQTEARLLLEVHLCLASSSSTVYPAFLTLLLSPESTASISILQESLSQALPQGNPTEDRYREKIRHRLFSRMHNLVEVYIKFANNLS